MSKRLTNDDLIARRLDAAEAAGKIPPALTRRSLENYVKVTKHIEPDPWQRDMCQKLETAFWIAQKKKFEFEYIDIGAGLPYYISPSGCRLNKEEFERERFHGFRAAVHAPPRHGKSAIISQCYPAWIFGWDPYHNFRLATYSMLHSARFSRVVKYLMRSPEHIAMFPDPKGHLPLRGKMTEWSTNARIARPDGQESFGALGLQSGFTGTGADTLIIDDPYKGMEEALSENIRDKTWRFWTDTADVRMDMGGDLSNVFIMFHRYHQDDMGGRAIGTGEFELWRYAAQCDGSLIDDVLGKDIVFPDPLGRQEGEYLSPRFSAGFYVKHKKNDSIWQSQFQGRPSAKTGKLFNVTLLQTILPKEARPLILHWVRAWDNAATSGGGAYTAGVLMGIDGAENIYIFDMVREQVNTAERQILQQETAEKDGKLVEIHAPEDPGSGGKDVAFDFEQVFARQGYKVTINKAGTSDDAGGNRVHNYSKVMRALSYSKAMNSRKVFLVLSTANLDEGIVEGTVPPWHKTFKNEHQYFPNSTYKDQVDCTADGYKHLMKVFRRGLVVKTAAEHNLLHRSLFANKFGDKIEGHWEVTAAVRLASDSSRPSGYCISARAAENAYLGDVVFIIAAKRMYVESPIDVLIELQKDLVKHCVKGVNHPSVVWLNKGGSAILPVAAQKLDMHLCEFDDDETAGILETNYYLQPTPGVSPFYKQPNGLPRIGATRCYALVDDNQFEESDVKDEGGMLSLRQDWSTWSYTDKGDVQSFAGITLDCLRMTLYNFAMSATGLTEDERLYAKLPKHLQPPAVASTLGTPQFIENHFAQSHALTMIRIKEFDERSKLRRNPKGDEFVGARAVTRRFIRGYRR